MVSSNLLALFPAFLITVTALSPVCEWLHMLPVLFIQFTNVLSFSATHLRHTLCLASGTYKQKSKACFGSALLSAL